MSLLVAFIQEANFGNSSVHVGLRASGQTKDQMKQTAGWFLSTAKVQKRTDGYGLIRYLKLFDSSKSGMC